MARFAVLAYFSLAASVVARAVQDSESSCGSGVATEGAKSRSCLIQARSAATSPALSRVPVGLDELSTPASMSVPAGLDKLSPTPGLALTAVKAAEPAADGDQKEEKAAEPAAEGDQKEEKAAEPAAEGDQKEEKAAEPAAEGDQKEEKAAEPAAEGDQKEEKAAEPAAEGDQKEEKAAEPAAEGDQKEEKAAEPAAEGDQKEEKAEEKAADGDKKEEKAEEKAADGDKKEEKTDKKDKKDGQVELPEDLKELGIEMFHSEEALNEIVANSEEISATVFDKKLTLRIKKGDNAIERLPDEGKTDEYGIKEILDDGDTKHGMINVIDMGANYGIVPIALFHTYPKLVRAVIAEPIPQTYFFLRWNLKLNNVPELTEEDVKKTGDDRTPGVLAIHQGVAEDDKDMSFCWAKNNSMNAAMCDCKRPPFPSECLKVKTISTISLLSLFGEAGVDFLKMDCEGCELHSLPALDKLEGGTSLVRRLVGELHEVPPKIEDMACKFTHKTWMTKVCAQPRGAGQQLECDPKTRDKGCYVPVPWPRP